MAQNNKKLFPGVKYPGVEATKGVIEEILGLKINYWAMIDLKGFEDLINAVGGIRLDIGKKVPVGSVDGPKGVYEWILPGKNVHLDGFHAPVVRPFAGVLQRLRADDPAEVRDERDAAPARTRPRLLTKFQDDRRRRCKQIVATNLPT